MPLNIKNAAVEHLVSELASRTGESKTEAVRRSLEERLDRVRLRDVGAGRRERVRRVLEKEIWPAIPAHLRGRTTTKAERESILGYGADGV